MSDPIDRLNHFTDGLEGGNVPVSAADVRRRGDQIRRRTHALIAGASTLAVAAVAVPIIALTSPGNDTEGEPPPVTERSSETPTDAAGGSLTEANLLADGDTVFDEFGSWHTAETWAGDGEKPFHPCAELTLTDQGASQIQNRAWFFESTINEDNETYLSEHALRESVAEFDDEETANNVATAIYESLLECRAGARFFPDYQYLEEAPVEGMTAEADLFGLYTSQTENVSEPGGGGYVRIMHTGVVQIENRIAVLTMNLGGQDYFTEPMQQMLPTVAERLVEDVPSGEPTEGDNAQMGVIPDDFPLEAGWPETAGDGEGLVGPNRELDPLLFTTPCDVAVRDLDHIDRLRADWSNAEDYRSRQLTIYGDAGTAAEAVAILVDQFQDCPVGPDNSGGLTHTETEIVEAEAGDEAWGILERDLADNGNAAPFGATTVVVRIGSAVLVIAHGGHAGTPGKDSENEVVTRLDEAAGVIALIPEIFEAMDDGAVDPDATGSPDGGLTDPAAVTEIPESFPLDVHLDEGVESAEVVGPDPFENGVFKFDMCGEDAAVFDQLDGNRLGYGERYEGEGYHGRAIRAYDTVQEAIDQMERLEAQLAACKEDVPFETDADRRWYPFEPATGWGDITFGFNYEGQAFGGLFSAVRVGNAILTLSTSGEYSRASLDAAIPGHAAVIEAIAPEMCIFTEDGC